MKNKKELKLLIAAFSMILISYSVLSSAGECHAAYQASYCSSGYSFGLSLGVFIFDILYVLLAMLFWFISPIGILFLLGIKLFFSEKASVVRRNFALSLQFLSFLSWSSLMFIFLVIYIDSISYRVLNLGGDMLNLAIKSGLGFMIFMVLLAVAEKKIVFENRNSCGKNEKSGGEKKNNDGLKKEKKKVKSIKIAGIEVGGIKEKIKSKIKEVVDDKIDEI